MSSRSSLAAAAVLLAGSAFAQVPGVADLAGHARDPLADSGHVKVLLFVRSDCPITNRYAPELQRIAGRYEGRPVSFWLVYPDRGETEANIRESLRQYGFPGTPLRDTRHALVRRAHAVAAPEAAVFDPKGKLMYHGRIDDWYVDIGKSRPAPRVHDLEDAIAAVLADKPVRQPETRAVGCSLADLD